MKGDSSAASYIHLVHHLIEKCLIFRMSKEECMEALSKNANINPIITSTVWNELEKENKEFFKAYQAKVSQSKIEDKRLSEEETNCLSVDIIVSDSPKGSSDD
ncbi:hypothetical protein PanWU01x14_042940 [Parasponia andersonii]|uniref:Angiotensin-converting enzyme 2 n=1 Tax=Parasponia andersonii TaxID=3476 RepID=A0A2P5DPW4_PARAD|nr:hypothetical protein PanWU01x14_042940 [Parasponia andersonii]